MSFSQVAKAIRSSETKFRKLKAKTKVDRRYKENCQRANALLLELNGLFCRLVNPDDTDPPSHDPALPSKRQGKGKGKGKAKNK